MTTLNARIASEIAERLVVNGYDTCTPEDVFAVATHGSVDQGGISDEYDENLTDQILDQLDAHGIETP